MLITRIEEADKSKYKIYIEDEYSFALYAKDIERYKLEEGTEISSTVYDTLMEEVVLPRAKQKAIAILQFMNRTEKELRRKLADADYSNVTIDSTIDYVKEYDYLNDERFTGVYVRSRMKTKSKLIIRTELMQKGIDRELIDQIMSQEYDDMEEEDPELIAIQKAIAKKTKFPDELTPPEKQKLMTSLYRKGFNSGKIRQLLP